MFRTRSLSLVLITAALSGVGCSAGADARAGQNHAAVGAVDVSFADVYGMADLLMNGVEEREGKTYTTRTALLDDVFRELEERGKDKTELLETRKLIEGTGPAWGGATPITGSAYLSWLEALGNLENLGEDVRGSLRSLEDDVQAALSDLVDAEAPLTAADMKALDDRADADYDQRAELDYAETDAQYKVEDATKAATAKVGTPDEAAAKSAASDALDAWEKARSAHHEWARGAMRQLERLRAFAGQVLGRDLTPFEARKLMGNVPASGNPLADDIVRLRAAVGDDVMQSIQGAWRSYNSQLQVDVEFPDIYAYWISLLTST